MEKHGGDVNELKRKVANLRKQCNEYDTLLKHFSLPHIDLPPNMQKDLDEHAEFKRKLSLYAMDSSFLSDFYCTNTEKNIGKKIAILKSFGCNEQIEKQLIKTKSNLAEAKSFGDSMKNEQKCYGNIDRLLRDADCQIKGFIEKKQKLKENITIDIDRILMKLEQLVPKCEKTFK
ncbi:uncharacterized protein LOC129575676 [Sitodiplosis mosellana]|uniref:uncharacterized protein LOC129575676 n=1 Tax=Sitodiplosis mosellana TaxID=263140 RepID=UPI00244532D3|nr:uncharacterized protein LOC129575676 [Sitodiplosis mosellana]XP_055315564.1 uncharacterized protein LOC129575676 [Sitodiplosis mosellana]